MKHPLSAPDLLNLPNARLPNLGTQNDTQILSFFMNVFTPALLASKHPNPAIYTSTSTLEVRPRPPFCTQSPTMPRNVHMCD